MATKAELDRLVAQCEECAGNDTRSYEEHFATCPKCQEAAERAQALNMQLEFLEGLASKPLEERKLLLGARMRQFLSMPGDQRKDAIGDLLDGLGDISEENRDAVVKARTDLMMEIPKEHRETLMDDLRYNMQNWTDERKMMEKQAIMNATEDYMFLKRSMVRKRFSKLME
jgi:hypothetical protein